MRPRSTRPANPDDSDPVHAFVETVIRTGLMFTDLLSGLLDSLPEGAFPGESEGEVLLEMVTGTIRPVADAAGERTVREATALLLAAGDKTIADLRDAADLARDR